MRYRGLAEVEAKRILIVKLGAVGDCLQAAIAVRLLRRLRPEAEIGWLVETKSRAAIEGNPDLTRVHVWDRKRTSAALKARQFGEAREELTRVRRELLDARYEVAVDMQNLFKSGAWMLASGAPTRLGFGRAREGNFLFATRRVPSRAPRPHMVRRYVALLAPLGVTWPTDVLDAVPVPVAEADRRVADEFFAAHDLTGRRVVAINPAASLARKVWPAERFAAVADRLVEECGVVPLVIWGPGEEAVADAVRQAARHEVTLAPPTTIRELAHLLSRCALYVGNDSGPMHIAAAMGAGVVGLFGPTAASRVAPWTSHARAVEPPAPFSQRRSVLGISANQVFDAAAALLEWA